MPYSYKPTNTSKTLSTFLSKNQIFDVFGAKSIYGGEEGYVYTEVCK